MQIDACNILKRVSSTNKVEDLVPIIRDFVTDLGFEYFSYGVRWQIPVTRRPVDIWQDYPADWMTHYTEQNYLQTDPTVICGSVESDLICWTPGLFSSAKALWNDAQDHGLRHGVAQSAWAQGGTFGLLSAARASQSICPNEYERLRMPFSWAANTFHARLTTLLKQSPNPSSIELTLRERDAMLWTAEGKTAAEVASILGCTKRTVEFHLNNAACKLNASNKTHAVVYALGMGLLTLQ